MTGEEKAAWDALTLDKLNHYDLDLDKARELLIEDGWTLNFKGQPFEEGSDDIRYKIVGSELMPLVLKFAKCEKNDFSAMMVDLYNETLPQIGAALDVEEVPFTELLSDYYRENGERRFDMNFMASNFVSVFDPYLHHGDSGNLQGVVNNVASQDKELMEHEWNMRNTEPGSLLEFETHWIRMQERFNEILPTMPLYSNIYFDFHTNWLQNYHPDQQYDWPVAMIYAVWGEPVEENEETYGEDAVESEGSISGMDLFSGDTFDITEYMNSLNPEEPGDTAAGEREDIPGAG